MFSKKTMFRSMKDDVYYEAEPVFRSMRRCLELPDNVYSYKVMFRATTRCLALGLYLDL